ncbi:MAG: S1C family serine protease [Treponema sp.]|jgi:serine protease Do|nr:S1C family serine protease [Treponema sp.]
MKIIKINQETLSEEKTVRVQKTGISAPPSFIIKALLFFAIFLFTVNFCFGQATALRDHVGLIAIEYHPDVVELMDKFKQSFERRGWTNAARAVDNYLQGLSGSGFTYIAPNGANYVLTNAHVVNHAQRLSITFETRDGTKITHEGLKVLLVDEEKDLAILYFEDGKRPFKQSLSFNTATIDEGMEVFAAGFPGLGHLAIWQFSSGIVSNSSARLPKNFYNDDMIGPFIQHTAQVDFGNSGGPLLVSARNVPAGYSVIGINTLSARRRQAANYAIPANQINAFIRTALSTEPVNENEIIAKRVDDFIKGIRPDKSNYSHISDFLTSDIIALNADQAFTQLEFMASRDIVTEIDLIFGRNFVDGMNAAVGWVISNTMRKRPITIALESIEPDEKGGFNVVLNVNGNIVETEWVKEHGVYRMNTYGTIVSGNRDFKRKKNQTMTGEAFYYSISAGYAAVGNNFDSAVAFSLTLGSPLSVGLDVVSTLNMFFGGDKYSQFSGNLGYSLPIKISSLAIIPFASAGANFIFFSPIYTGSFYDTTDNDIGAFVRGGIVFTGANDDPGIFGRLFYSYHFETLKNYVPGHSVFGIAIGYGLWK